MFFMLSKGLAFILTPSNFVILIGLFGLVLVLLRWPKSGWPLLIMRILGVALAGLSPLGPVLLMTLEDRFPKQEVPPIITGIVMLGGAVDIHVPQARGSEAWNDQAERITAVAELANRFPAARIILSGGSGHPDAISESSIAKQALAAMGVPKGRMELETRSRNTCENASESVITAKPKPSEVWLLVTSASHMLRAIACFRATNFLITPFPVDYHTRGKEDLRRMQESVAEGLAHVDIAAHEWTGLITYRLTGLTHELFPGP
ncbi:MAG: YdcF family protein [Aestuariivirga sp.]|nr:YdcF family protein [Aestuariivirga sp.]